MHATANKKFTTNFKHLILGKSFLNVADSFYTVAVTIGLIQVYQIDAGSLSSFTLVSMLPAMFGFLFGHIIDKTNNKRRWLINFQCLHVVFVIGIICCLWFSLPLVFLFVLNFLFHTVNTAMNALETSFVPQALDENKKLIEKSVDIQYLTGNILNIASNFFASVLLGLVTYFVVLNISLPFFVAGIFFFWRIKVANKNCQKTCLDETATSEQNDKNPNTVRQYGNEVSKTLSYFFSQRTPSAIIACEAFLSGALDMLIALAPLYLITINIDAKWLGMILAVQQGADLIGAALAPFIKIKMAHFFCIDYLLSGSALLALFLIPNVWIKLLLFGLSFVIIGISGNYFSKMLFASYDHQKLGSIDTIMRTLYAVFATLFLLIPLVYCDIVVLGVTLNGMTILFGIGIAWRIYGSAITKRMSKTNVTSSK